MKTLNLNLIAVLSAMIIATLTGFGQEEGKSKSFSVTKGGEVEVITSVGDIEFSTWEKNEVRVTITGMDDDEYKDVEMTQSGNNVLVSYRGKGYNIFRNVSFDITVPMQSSVFMNTSGGDLMVRGNLNGKVKGSTSGGDIKLNDIFGGPVEVSTSGGDIAADRIQADAVLKTSGGDILTGKIDGNLTVHTSGGDIKIDGVSKSLEANTSGGDIRVGNVGGKTHLTTSGGNISIGDVGGEGNFSTSGGNISAGRMSGKVTLNTSGGNIDLKGAYGRVIAKTAGGNLDLQSVTGSIEGRTSGGEINASLIPSGKEGSRLSSSGGNVRIYVDEKAKVTIEAVIRLSGWGGSGKKYSVISDFPKEQHESSEDSDEIREIYKLNGGGELIELSTSNSNIEIYKLHK
jgi:hypothetical protein